MDIKLHNTEKISFGEIEKIEGQDGVFYTRDIFIITNQKHTYKGEKNTPVKITCFADDKSKLQFNV